MPEVEKLVDTINLSQDIPTTLNTLNQLHISENERHNLRTRIHNLIPTHSMIIVDPNNRHSKGFMQVEPYPYGTSSGDRRVFEISQKKDRNLFEVYYTAFNNMWNKANDYKF
jgi:hypothetical protein